MKLILPPDIEAERERELDFAARCNAVRDCIYVSLLLYMVLHLLGVA